LEDVFPLRKRGEDPTTGRGGGRGSVDFLRFPCNLKEALLPFGGKEVGDYLVEGKKVLIPFRFP